MGSNGIGGNANGELHTEDEALERPARRRHRQGHGRPRPHRRGRARPTRSCSRAGSTSSGRPSSSTSPRTPRSGRPDVFTDEEREFLHFGFSEFFLGEERVTTELLPFAIAAPAARGRAFLATQISDEAKHMVFFDRFYREVFGVDARDAIGEKLEAAALRHERATGRRCSTASSTTAPSGCARTRPTSTALVRGVTVYMVVIEGTLALTGARFIIRNLKERGLLPGFRQGFTAVNRDESRHVGFGVKFLADAIKEDARQRADDRGHAQGDAAGRHARRSPRRGSTTRTTSRRRSVPLVRDLRVRDEVAVEEARRDGDGAGDARRPR